MFNDFMTCGCCEFTDDIVYTSMPPQVRCLKTDKFHFMDDMCDLDKGDWIIRGGSRFLICPQCSFKVKVEDDLKNYNYCPKCGSRNS